MRNYSKVGNRRGRPAYRTPASFRIRKGLAVRKIKYGRRAPQHPLQP